MLRFWFRLCIMYLKICVDSWSCGITEVKDVWQGRDLNLREESMSKNSSKVISWPELGENTWQIRFANGFTCTSIPQIRVSLIVQLRPKASNFNNLLLTLNKEARKPSALAVRWPHFHAKPSPEKNSCICNVVMVCKYNGVLVRHLPEGHEQISLVWLDQVAQRTSGDSFWSRPRWSRWAACKPPCPPSRWCSGQNPWSPSTALSLPISVLIANMSHSKDDNWTTSNITVDIVTCYSHQQKSPVQENGINPQPKKMASSSWLSAGSYRFWMITDFSSDPDHENCESLRLNLTHF